MRIVPVAALLLLASASGVRAQSTFGISLGMNASNVAIPDYEASSTVEKLSRLGLNAGVFADVAITPSISFHPELAYSQKGYKINYNLPVLAKSAGGGFDGSITRQIDYIEVPLLVAYHIPAGTGLDVAVEVGPYVAYKINEGQSCSDGDQISCNANDGNDEDVLNNVDFGAAGGIVASAGPFGFGARYSTGFANLVDSENSGDDKITNNAISVFARYRFGQ